MALSLNIHRPFASDTEWLRNINWHWWLQRVPMLLLAAPSAYGVGAFASEHLPIYVAAFAGGAFECAYLGCIALADQQHDDDDHWTTVLWWLVNAFAVVASVLSNLLFFAGGHYSGITPEVATHAVPLPVLGFSYGLLLHRTSAKAAKAAAVIAQKRQAEDEDQALREKYRCKYGCGYGATSDAALRGHYGRCPNKPKNIM
jgi:hypothetical protein